MNELRPWVELIAARWRRLLVGGLLMFATVLAGIGLLALSGWFITATALTGLLLAAGVAAQLDIYTPGGGIRFLPWREPYPATWSGFTTMTPCSGYLPMCGLPCFPAWL